MSNNASTKLRFVSSKDERLILAWVNRLPYKIEIKGAPIFARSRWYLYFVIPDLAGKEILSGQLD